MGFSKQLWAGTITKKTESGCSSCLQSLSCKSPARHARHCSADGEMLEIPSKALRAANSPACCPWRGLDKRVNWYSVAMDNRSRHLSIVASTWMGTCTFPCQSHVVPDLVIFWFCVCVCGSMINIYDRLHKPNCGWGAILSLEATTGQNKFWHSNQFKVHDTSKSFWKSWTKWDCKASTEQTVRSHPSNDRKLKACNVTRQPKMDGFKARIKPFMIHVCSWKRSAGSNTSCMISLILYIIDERESKTKRLLKTSSNPTVSPGIGQNN